MSDLQAFISDRKKSDPKFEKGYHKGFRSFKNGVLLKQAGEETVLTQDYVALQLKKNHSFLNLKSCGRYSSFSARETC